MTTKISYAITDNNVTVNYEGQTHIVARTDSLADKLIAALREGRKDEIPALVNKSKQIEQYGDGSFTVKNGSIFVNGQPVHHALSGKILKFSAEGLPHEPLVKFAQNLQKNPSYRAVTELFQFLEKNDHPITDDGNFIAYKRVRADFKDIHSGTFDNSVGTSPEMPRNQVNEDSSQTCAAGLHVANWHYAHTQFASSNSFTDVMLEVEVNPADVVSIPDDYNNSKMRVCKYKVLGVVDKEHSSDVSIRATSSVCNSESLDEERLCERCDIELYDSEYDMCNQCHDDLEEEEAEEFEKEEYPWEDEVL